MGDKIIDIIFNTCIPTHVSLLGKSLFHVPACIGNKLLAVPITFRHTASNISSIVLLISTTNAFRDGWHPSLHSQRYSTCVGINNFLHLIMGGSRVHFRLPITQELLDHTLSIFFVLVTGFYLLIKNFKIKMCVSYL